MLQYFVIFVDRDPGETIEDEQRAQGNRISARILLSNTPVACFLCHTHVCFSSTIIGPSSCLGISPVRFFVLLWLARVTVSPHYLSPTLFARRMIFLASLNNAQISVYGILQFCVLDVVFRFFLQFGHKSDRPNALARRINHFKLDVPRLWGPRSPAVVYDMIKFRVFCVYAQQNNIPAI